MKQHNIYAKELRCLGQFKMKVVPSKKGKGSWKRKGKHKETLQ